jgi:hypothetical protein
LVFRFAFFVGRGIDGRLERSLQRAAFCVEGGQQQGHDLFFTGDIDVKVNG